MADDVADSEIWVPSDLKDLAVASSSSSSNHSSLSLGDCEMLLAERSPAADDPEPCSAATAWASSPTSSGVAATICGSSSSQLQLQAIPDVMPIRQFMQAISSRLQSFLQRPPANNLPRYRSLSTMMTSHSLASMFATKATLRSNRLPMVV